MLLCLFIAGWERADLLALLCDVLLCFVTFPCGIMGQVWYLIVSIPDLCRLSYFISFFVFSRFCIHHFLSFLTLFLSVATFVVC